MFLGLTAATDHGAELQRFNGGFIIKLIIIYPRRLSVMIFPEAYGGRFISIFSQLSE